MRLILMIMKYFKKPLFVFLVLILPSFTFAEAQKEMAEKIDSIEEFKETRHISIDKIYLPKELKIIEEEISQNAIDVIILSGTHNLVFNILYNKEGYLKTYKNFYSLKIEILPHSTSDGHFLLNLFYYNWTTKKEDHRLTIKISKYNVLNELRMNLYRLFKGKNFVESKKEELEKSNYERIQAVAKSIEDKKRRKKIKEKAEAKKNQQSDPEEIAKKKDKEEHLEREEAPKALAKNKNNINPVTNNTPSNTSEIEQTKTTAPEIAKTPLLPEEEEDKKETVKKNRKKSEKQTLENETPSEAPIPNEAVAEIPTESEPSIPRKSKFHFLGGYHFENIITTGILKTTTNPKFIIAGANYENLQDVEMPHGFILGMKAGFPIVSGGYQVPVYREIQSEFFYKNLIPNLSMGLGLDISSIFFVNLPNLGKDLQVFENDIYWAKFGLKYSFSIYDKMQSVAIYNYKDLVVKSNFKKNISVSRLKIVTSGKVTEKFGYTLDHFRATLNGEISGNLKGYSFAINYYFGD